MVESISKQSHKPRELRRRVVTVARLRRARGWSDATILNISSRGLQIQTNWPLEEGSWIELRRGEHVIHAEVIWHKGARAGLRSESRLAIEDIVASDPKTLILVPGKERRRQPRPEDQARIRGRIIEFAGVLSVVLILGIGLLVEFQQSFARPMAAVAAALP